MLLLLIVLSSIGQGCLRQRPDHADVKEIHDDLGDDVPGRRAHRLRRRSEQPGTGSRRRRGRESRRGAHVEQLRPVAVIASSVRRPRQDDDTPQHPLQHQPGPIAIITTTIIIITIIIISVIVIITIIIIVIVIIIFSFIDYTIIIITTFIIIIIITTSQEELEKVIREMGFGGRCDNVYVIPSYRLRTNIGDAFVNLIDEASADAFKLDFDGFRFPNRLNLT